LERFKLYLNELWTGVVGHLDSMTGTKTDTEIKNIWGTIDSCLPYLNGKSLDGRKQLVSEKSR
jgi:hypothetical protein